MLVDLPPGVAHQDWFGAHERISRGLYRTGVNFSYAISDVLVEENPFNPEFQKGVDHKEAIRRILNPPEGEPPSSFGVCDYPEQVIEMYPMLDTDQREFIVCCTEVRKADQPRAGGWRWHKWGPYIGKQDPQYEYLHDEPAIDVVWAFQIFHIKDGLKTWEER